MDHHNATIVYNPQKSQSQNKDRFD